MFVNVTISLGAGEALAKSAQQIAEDMMVAIGGNPSTDIVNVQVSDTGSAGQVAPIPGLAQPQPAETPPA